MERLQKNSPQVGLPVSEAAELLGVSQKVLRRWLREGAPYIYRCEGRGRPYVVDPVAISQWVKDRNDAATKPLRQLADEFPQLLAKALEAAFQNAEGVDKRKLAGILAATWEYVTRDVQVHLSRTVPNLPDITTTPEPIATMFRISRH